MKKNIVIGADIGGSHITSAAVDLDNLQIVKGSLFSHKVDNKALKGEILKSWSVAINQSIKSVDLTGLIKIGFAIPGPFQYKTGVAMFETNDKYENLFKVSVAKELPQFLNGKDHKLRFLNDATSFGVGVAKMGEAKGSKKIIAITLGTGFGSTFINNGIPQVNAIDVPKDGCLWDKPFQNGVADEYFSTRWFIKTYKELSGEEIKGVKEISQAKNEYAMKTFEKFSQNLAEFMNPVIKNYQPDLIVLGGNISNANKLFLPKVKDHLKKEGADVRFGISSLMEEAAIIGSSRLFEPEFWNEVKNDLPDL